jgi:hypothetical protein
MRLDDALQLGVLVATGKEQRPVEEVGETGAEEVEARIDRGGGMCARDRVVDGRPGEIVNGKLLGRCIADGVPGEHHAAKCLVRVIRGRQLSGGPAVPFCV